MEERIIVDCLRGKLPFPKKIANAPTIPLGMEGYIVAFYELDTCRGGMGGPIPWMAIHEYALRQGWDDEEFSDLLFFVRALDKVILARTPT